MPAAETPSQAFARCCEARRVKKPSRALVQLWARHSSLDDITAVDLTGHYLGVRQILAVVDFLAHCRQLRSLNLRGQCCYAADLGGVWHGTKSASLPSGNEVWSQVLQMIRAHPTLADVDLSDNDCGPLVGRQLQDTVAGNTRITRLVHDNVLIDEETLTAIDAQVRKNGGGASSSPSPRSEGRGRVLFAEPAPEAASNDGDGGFGAFGGFGNFDTGNTSAVNQEPSSPKKYAGRRQSKSAQPITREDIEAFVPPVHPKSAETMAFLKTLLQQNLLFSHLQSHEMEVVLQALFEKNFSINETIMIEGDDGDNMYTIEKGTVDIIVDERKVAQKTKGISFGELALMYNCPRSATVVAATNVKAWGIDQETYRNIVMAASIKKRNEYSDVLSKISFLQSLTDYERMQLSDALESQEWCDGDQILTYDQPGEHMYIVLSGEVVVTGRDGEGKPVEVCRFAQGRHFGELEFINNHKVVADVTVVGNTRTARINRAHFELCLGPLIDMMKRNVASEEYTYYRSTMSSRNLKKAPEDAA